MIDEEEINRVSIIKGLTKRNTEKDYLLEMVLFLLYREIGRKMVFKGGTALYKLYSLNRFSEDLDFTLTHSKIDCELIFRKVINSFGDIGINGRIKEIEDYKNQKNIKLELRGPLFDGNPKSLAFISINISLKEAVIYPPEQKTIFSQYPEIPAFDVFVMPMEELFAEKVRALVTRNKARDLYDIWFLLNKGAKVNRKDINRKLKLYRETFNIKKIIQKIESLRKEWKMDIEGLVIGQLKDFDTVKKEVIGKMSG